MGTLMGKTREQVQSEALLALKSNNYTGTVVLSTGTGKSKVAIDAIKEKGFKNILITSPRTNLKDNWLKELLKWRKLEDGTINTTLENIQTCYKWKKWDLSIFDLIICDEVHTMITDEYGDLIIKANELNIPVIGLTATEDNDKLAKKIFYQKYIPIVYKYKASAEDGLVNKRRYFAFTYDLTNDFKVLAGSKKKWEIGELKQYEYLTTKITEGQDLMAKTGSVDWFEDAARWYWKKEGTPEEKTAGRMYLSAIKFRKHFLWNLNSSAFYANAIKRFILKNPNNKVLIFSEHIAQADKMSSCTVHGKQKPDKNKEFIEKFDKGDIKVLGSCQSLTLGMNLVGANFALMESYNGSDVSFDQRAGRTDRLDKDDVATVIFIVPSGTQTEQWFQRALKNIDNSQIQTITDINQIDYEINKEQIKN